jgi:hypothetical protein
MGKIPKDTTAPEIQVPCICSVCKSESKETWNISVITERTIFVNGEEEIIYSSDSGYPFRLCANCMERKSTAAREATYSS